MLFIFECFPLFRRGPWSVMINATQPRSYWSTDFSSCLQAALFGAAPVLPKEPLALRNLMGSKHTYSLKVMLLVLPSESSQEWLHRPGQFGSVV